MSTPEERAEARRKRAEMPEAARKFAKAQADADRAKYEKDKERIRIQEEIAAGKRKPFFKRRKIDPNKPTMWWLNDKEK